VTAPAVRDYQLLLPAGWLRIPLDDRAQQRIVLLAKTQTRDVPPDQREAVRNALVEVLTAAAGDAAGAGGTDVIVCTTSLEGVPISASCVVSHHPGSADSAVDLAGRLTELDGNVTVVELAGASAVRRVSSRDIPYDAVLRSRLKEKLGRGARDHDPVAHEVTFFVPLPASTGWLVFTFSTPQPALADALEALFDAIMSTLRWVR